jgi:hypothetical protein
MLMSCLYACPYVFLCHAASLNLSKNNLSESIPGIIGSIKGLGKCLWYIILMKSCLTPYASHI